MAKFTKKADSESKKNKAECPISRKEFDSFARAMAVSVGGQSLIAEPKQFSTGSFGWYLNGKTIVVINGKDCKVQIGMNMTVIGSKEAVEEKVG